MKVAAVAPSPLPAGPGGALKAVRPGEAARCGPGPGAIAAEQAAAALLYDMKGCYSRLRALVPTLPRHRRVSKVELLQHVIDYIWDLQLALQPGPPRPPNAAEPPEVSAVPGLPRALPGPGVPVLPPGPFPSFPPSPPGRPPPLPPFPGRPPPPSPPCPPPGPRAALTARSVPVPAGSVHARCRPHPVPLRPPRTCRDPPSAAPRMGPPGTDGARSCGAAARAPPPHPGASDRNLLRLLRAFPVLYITMMLENIVLQ
uniref:DNA-binding protein inhibitor ID-4 n=1 Tax=Cairina moschata TaxID=8855 RepID=A0A8C3CEB0_CAIMO